MYQGEDGTNVTNHKKSGEKKFLNFSMTTESFQMETNYINKFSNDPQNL